MPIARVVVQIHNDILGGDGTNTWHFRSVGDFGDTPAFQSAMGELETFYESISAHMANGTTFEWDGLATSVEEEPQQFVSSEPWTTGAATGGNPLPPAECLVIGWRTANASRSGRGRTFLGPVGTSGLQEDGTPGTTMLSVVRDAAAALIAAMDGPVDGAFGVYSRQDDLVRDFTGAVVRDVFGILRSRRD